MHIKPPIDKYPYTRKFPRPIEVFGNGDYSRYSVRGQILDFPYESYGPVGKKLIFYHQLRLLVLVSPTYNDQEPDLSDYYRFGKIIGRTQADFESMKSSIIKKIYPVDGQIIEPEKLPDPIIIDLDKFGLNENDHVKECLIKKQDMMLVGLDMVTTDCINDKFGRRMKDQPLFTHPFTSHYFGVKGILSNEVRAWFSNLYDTLVFELNYKGISKKEFFRLLDTVGIFSEMAVIGHWEISTDDIKEIYAFVEGVEDSKDILTRFCFSFLNDLLEDLHQKKIISRCGFCGNAFVYNKHKKYCSLVSEGKDCGKKARNSAFYQKHKEKIRPKARQAVSEFRKFCKEKGAKKKRSY